jgi:hypothetical protein
MDQGASRHSREYKESMAETLGCSGGRGGEINVGSRIVPIFPLGKITRLPRGCLSRSEGYPYCDGTKCPMRVTIKLV